MPTDPFDLQVKMHGRLYLISLWKVQAGYHLDFAHCEDQEINWQMTDQKVVLIFVQTRPSPPTLGGMVPVSPPKRMIPGKAIKKPIRNSIPIAM